MHAHAKGNALSYPKPIIAAAAHRIRVFQVPDEEQGGLNHLDTVVLMLEMEQHRSSPEKGPLDRHAGCRNGGVRTSVGTCKENSLEEE